MKGRVLIVAGSDSGGGAGIQADIKTVTALDGFAMTAITALTAQNTIGVQGVVPIDPAFIVQQIEVVLSDLGADAIKTGMLHSVAVIEAVSEALRRLAPAVPLVVDPVMVAKGGHRLLEGSAEASLRDTLLPLAALVTPNLPEAEVLTGRSVRSEADMREAAKVMSDFGPRAVLMKGGHLEGDSLIDLLYFDGRFERIAATRIATRHTHGTGCTTASAIATGLAQGMDLVTATMRAHRYVRDAISAAPGFGRGHGPLGHSHTVRGRGC